MQAEVLRAVARERQARGEDAPTVGRFFSDTPGVRHTGDRSPGHRLVAFERWAMEDRQEAAVSGER